MAKVVGGALRDSERWMACDGRETRMKRGVWERKWSYRNRWDETRRDEMRCVQTEQVESRQDERGDWEKRPCDVGVCYSLCAKSASDSEYVMCMNEMSRNRIMKDREGMASRERLGRVGARRD